MAADASSRPSRAHLAAIAREATESGIGALVGLAFGGPPGAVIGATAGATATAAAQLIATHLRVRQRRVHEVLDSAASIAGIDVQSLEAVIMTDEARLDLVVDALEAASRASGKEKLDALAAAIARSANADGALELHRLGVLLRAIRDLDALHVQVIIGVRDRFPDGATPDDLEKYTSVPTYELRAVVRLLELHGLIVDESRLGRSTEVKWKLGEVGVLCAELIRLGQRRTASGSSTAPDARMEEDIDEADCTTEGGHAGSRER